MAGRTVSRWLRFAVGDNANVLREIPIWSITIVGIQYAQIDLTAFQDAVKGMLPGFPDAPIEITGPYDTTAAAGFAASTAAPTLSGSHTVLTTINGGNTPRTVGVLFGDRTYWATGAPVFGANQSSASGYLCFEYTVIPKDPMSYKAIFKLFPGSTIPTWGSSIPV